MLTESRGLSTDDLIAIKALEERVIANDGGRLKLEWGVLHTRVGDQVDDLLWRDHDRLLGFLGLYSFGGALELAGMVDPAVRRQGIGSALLEAAMRTAAGRGVTSALLVTPRAGDAGAKFAAAHDGVLDHSEHFLTLGTTPAEPPPDAAVSLRPATGADRDVVGRILTAAFGHETRDLVLSDSPTERTLVVERAGTVVGTLRTTQLGDHGAIYGFGVEPAMQGRGIGRAALTQACRQLRADGASTVALEVEVNNDPALELYLSVGFERTATDDYFAVPIS